jgi:hypothetical protein
MAVPDVALQPDKTPMHTAAPMTALSALRVTGQPLKRRNTKHY